ncbi:Solute carrier family 22 member 6-A [Portunus trituberculatus]|uniref:Solute carrier family 22 member 6-A n=1 Tax=Portunus trituberculatus TaxID=210409 RepID=A0A5B7E2S6_PORTR|nr:Solute carrier family 22 member 6-A [Portunus trituberculatus]
MSECPYVHRRKELHGDSCSYYVKDPSREEPLERPCKRWSFDNSTFVSTVTSEVRRDEERRRREQSDVYISFENTTNEATTLKNTGLTSSYSPDMHSVRGHSDFGLVCGMEYLRAAYTSIYMFGVMVGAPLNGLLADKYGRRPTITIGSVVYAVVALASCWLPSLVSVLISRFLLGTLHATILKTGYILGMAREYVAFSYPAGLDRLSQCQAIVAK